MPGSVRLQSAAPLGGDAQDHLAHALERRQVDPLDGGMGSLAGARFAQQFARAHRGAVVEPSTIYAAQATEVVLDAIARSDGSRGSVLDQLFKTRVTNGLLGTFAFDANGDTTESPITIFRVSRGGGKNTVLGVEGGVVERVARPSQRLVAP